MGLRKTPARQRRGLNRRRAPRAAARYMSRQTIYSISCGVLLTVGLVAFGVSGCRSEGRQSSGGSSSLASLFEQRKQPMPLPDPVRAVWVARFHYEYAEDIATIMANCAKLGANTVLWQVRGEGTVAYPSKIEPWSREYGFRDPGFDPLRVAVEEAHKNGLRIEAWCNVMPGWKGPEPPPIREQLYFSHPEWFMHDAAGRRQPLTAVDPKTKKPESFYVILNPCLPEVRAYIRSVFEEIASNYDIDGLHLDYVRYAWDTTPNARNLYPRDPRTLSLFQRQTGKRPDDDPAAWDGWRANQITQLVSEVRTMLNRRRPGASLTAAVWSDPRNGYREYFQNAIAWLRSGLLDAAMPMAYTAELAQFDNHIGAYKSLAPQARIIPGLGLYKHETPEQIGRQLERCRIWGGDWALFSYDSLHATAADRETKGPSPQTQRQREMRRSVLGAMMRP